jgi:hypothetical protein
MWTIVALVALALAFCWLAMRFREVGPLTEELQKTREENLKLQSELQQTREALRSCQNAIENH